MPRFSHNPKSHNTVVVPSKDMPDVRTWAWCAWLSSLRSDLKYYGSEGHMREMRLRELRGLVTIDKVGEAVWVWSHNGAGDFVRISSAHYKHCRWMVVFNHESGRSPWGIKNDEQPFAPGFDWISEYQMEIFLEGDLKSDHFLGYPHLTEVYRLENYDGLSDEWTTSPEMAQVSRSFRWRSSQEGSESELYQRLMKEDYPTLDEVREITGDDLFASICFANMDLIRKWLAPKPEH